MKIDVTNKFGVLQRKRELTDLGPVKYVGGDLGSVVGSAAYVKMSRYNQLTKRLQMEITDGSKTE